MALESKLTVKLTSAALKYLETLDRPTRNRIQEKLESLAEDPFDPRLSKPLTGVSKRTARVGDYRILFEVYEEEKLLVVADIGPRGRVYRRLR